MARVSKAQTVLIPALPVLLAAAIVLLAGAGGEAALLVYDGFADGGASPGAGEYQTTPASTNGYDNNSLHGQGPALTGFDAGENWSGTAFASYVYFRAEGGGLSYTDGGGNTLQTTAGQVNLFRSTPGTYDKSISRVSNDAATPPSTMYFSGLMQFQSGLRGRLQTKWGNKTPIGIGFDLSGHAEIGLGNTGNVRGTSAGAFAADTTHLLVGKIVEGGGGGVQDSVTLYVDPADLTFEAANTPTLANVDLNNSYYVGGNPSYALDSIHLAGSVNNVSSLLYDEFRVASTWAEVVPIAGAPPPPELSFQEGVSPTPAYTADSVTIRSDRADTNQDNDPDFENIVGRVGTSFMRVLYEFDLSEITNVAGGLPVTIDSARLELVTRPEGSGSGQGGAFTVDLHDYGFDFVESAATWNDPDGDGSAGTGDTTAGGTLGALLSSVDVSGTGTPGGSLVTLADSAAFRAAVADALGNPDSTLRLLMKARDESGSGNRFIRFRDEVFTSPAGYRPKLVVGFTIVPEPATLLIWSVLAGLGIVVGWRRSCQRQGAKS